jgi:hypothetical protein
MPLFYSCLLFIFSCLTSHAQRIIDSVDYKYGGGFTGITTTYRLTPKKIYQANGMITLVFSDVRKMKNSTWKKIYAAAKNVLNIQSPINSPSNEYQSIIIYAGAVKSIYTWSVNDQVNISNLSSLVQLIKNASIK